MAPRSGERALISFVALETGDNLPAYVETLADRIAREGPLNELDAVGWAIRLAKRIEAMHALGVTHGSVSPQCVQIEGKDRTARAYLVDVRRTSSNPAFHSPERLSGGSLSQADDTWALACTLYAALTGNPPFSGANDAEVKQRVLTSSPAPLAVFDVGDDDLQRVLEDAFARDLSHRTSSVGALRAALEEWHPDPNVGGLPGLEDEDTEGGLEDDEDERTIMRPAPGALARALNGASPAVPVPIAPAAPVAPPPVVPAKAPPAGVPPPRASSPGVARAPLGSAPGVSPLAQPRSGPAARAIPSPRGSTPGLPAPVAPPPRATSVARAGSSPNLPAGEGRASGDFPPRASGDFPLRASGDFPAPLGPPSGLMDKPLPAGDDEDEDEKTMMRTVPEHLGAAIAARSGASPEAAAPPRTGDATRSGAFAAASPTKSGAFPALVNPPALDLPADDLAGGDDAEEEATRMMQSPAFPPPDEDDQATIMRPSVDAEDERLRKRNEAPEPQPAPEAHDSNFASTVALDALGLAPSPPEVPVAPPVEPLPAVDPSAAPFVATPLSPSAMAPMPPAPVPGLAPLAPPPRRSVAVWLAVILVLLAAAGATFFFLRMR